MMNKISKVSAMPCGGMHNVSLALNGFESRECTPYRETIQVYFKSDLSAESFVQV